jgi:hypothetical protein
MVAESSYEELHFQLDRADRLTFVSDGGVEARNKSGELFGFDRTATSPRFQPNRLPKPHGASDRMTTLPFYLSRARL